MPGDSAPQTPCGIRYGRTLGRRSRTGCRSWLCHCAVLPANPGVPEVCRATLHPTPAVVRNRRPESAVARLPMCTVSGHWPMVARKYECRASHRVTAAECRLGPHDLGEDGVGLGGPDKRFGVLVVVVDVVAECADQCEHAAEDAAALAVYGEVTEEASHHVEPRGTGRSELTMEAGMALEAALHLGLFVRSAVVGNEGKLLSRAAWRRRWADGT